MLRTSSRTFRTSQVYRWHWRNTTSTFVTTWNAIPRLRAFPEREVENTGSMARDHLANERTWLAWTRTALAFAALGLGLDRFDQFRQDAEHIAHVGDIANDTLASPGKLISKQSSDSTSPPNTVLTRAKPGDTEISMTTKLGVATAASASQTLSAWAPTCWLPVSSLFSLAVSGRLFFQIIPSLGRPRSNT